MTPFTCQVTDVLLVFCTVAVNGCVAPPIKLALFGEMLMLTGTGTVSVTWAEADLLVSALETAATVTTVGTARFDGAL